MVRPWALPLRVPWSLFFPQLTTDVGAVSRVGNFGFFLLIVGWKLSLRSVALCLSPRSKGQCTGQEWEMED